VRCNILPSRGVPGLTVVCVNPSARDHEVFGRPNDFPSGKTQD